MIMCVFSLCLKHKPEHWKLKSDRWGRSFGFGIFLFDLRNCCFQTKVQSVRAISSPSSHRAIEVIVQSWLCCCWNEIETQPRGMRTQLNTSSVMITWTPPRLFSPPLETVTALFLGTVTLVHEFTFPPSRLPIVNVNQRQITHLALCLC